MTRGTALKYKNSSTDRDVQKTLGKLTSRSLNVSCLSALILVRWQIVASNLFSTFQVTFQTALLILFRAALHMKCKRTRILTSPIGLNS